MNDARISQFNAAGALSGEEYVPIAQFSNVTGASRTVYTNPNAFKQFVIDSVADVFCPVGSVGTYASSLTAADAPAGWLLCNGQSVSRTTYKKLFDRIGTSYGCNSDSTFKLPDLKGRVVMGYCSTASSISLSEVKNGNWINTSPLYLGSVGGKFNHQLTSTDIPLKASTATIISPLAPAAAVVQERWVNLYGQLHYGGSGAVSMSSQVTGGLRGLFGGTLPSQITFQYGFGQSCGLVTNGGTWQSLGCSGNNASLGGTVVVAPDSNGDVFFQVTDQGWGGHYLGVQVYVKTVSQTNTQLNSTVLIAKQSTSNNATPFGVTQPYVVMNYIIKY